MNSEYDSWPSVNKALASFMCRRALVVCILLLKPLIVSAGTIVIGQINPPGLTEGGVAGITFDRETNPLVIDGFGRTMCRLNLQDASVISTFSLITEEIN